MKSPKDALLEYKSRVIDSYIDWHKNKAIEGKGIILARTCLEILLKAEIIRNYEKFRITEFFDKTFEKLVEEKIISGNANKEFTLYTCIEALVNNGLLVKYSEEYKCIKYIQIGGNKQGHGKLVVMKFDVEETNKCLLKILNGFFSKTGDSDWVEKYAKPQLRDMYLKISQDISNELAPKIIGQIEDYKKSNEINFTNALHEIKNNVEAIKIEFTKKKEKSKNFKIYRIITIIALISSLAFYFYFTNKTSNNKKPRNNIYSNTPFDTTKECYNVLLFPFQPLEMCQFKKTDIELAIISRLIDMSEKDSLNLQIKYDTLDCIHSYSEADSIGKKLNANLVIWGDLYEHCSIDNEACLKFVNISSEDKIPNIDMKGESGIEKMTSLSEVKEGKLQKNIDYIIYWVAGSRSFKKQNYTRAINYFTKIKESYNVTSELYSFIGDTYYLLKSFKNAKAFYDKALEINPDFAEVHNNYSVLLLESEYNDSVGAKEHLEKSLKIYPNSDVTQHNLAFLLDNIFNDINGAKEHYEKSLKINPKNAKVQFDYANLLNDKIKDINSAKEHYEMSLKICPNYEQVHIKYAVLLFKHLHKPKDAELHCKIALEINPNNITTHIIYASILIYLYRDIDKAKIHFEKALEIDPNSFEAQYVYAVVLYELYNDIEGAEMHFEKAISLSPNDAHAHYDYAFFLKNKLKNINKAREQYNEAIRIDTTMKKLKGL